MNVTRKHLLIVIAVLLLLLLVGCGAPVTSGTVTAKNYEAEEIEMETRCLARDAKNKCTNSVTVPELEPEVFELVLTDPEGRTGTVEVPADVWNQTQIGDTYPR